MISDQPVTGRGVGLIGRASVFLKPMAPIVRAAAPEAEEGIKSAMRWSLRFSTKAHVPLATDLTNENEQGVE